MQNSEKYLLSTRPLPKALVDEAAINSIVIEELSFIHTTAIANEAVRQKIEAISAEKHTVVFTSMNAVEAVATHAIEVAQWRIYCIGNTTAKLITEKWGPDKIVATAENAQRLGERLIDDGMRHVVFFCGNIRRDELPNKIRSEGGTVEEVVVYNTEETPQQLSKDYDGILFFSPSAVESFYKNNKPTKSTVLFAIGKTTAEALRLHKANKIVVAHVTGKEDLVRHAMSYFTNGAV